MAQLVDDLLDYSTIEAGRFRLNSRAENIRQLLESVVEMLAPRAHEKNIEIGATVASDVPPLMDFDPARLRQVLFNVIGNAGQVHKEGRRVICVNLDGPQLVITVSDTGPGMSEEDRDRIFEEFEQVGNASERSGGTGLGLSISSASSKSSAVSFLLKAAWASARPSPSGLPAILPMPAGKAAIACCCCALPACCCWHRMDLRHARPLPRLKPWVAAAAMCNLRRKRMRSFPPPHGRTLPSRI